MLDPRCGLESVALVGHDGVAARLLDLRARLESADWDEQAAREQRALYRLLDGDTDA